jgi:hypothetical protein
MQTTFNHQLEAQHLQPIHHASSPEDEAQAESPSRTGRADEGRCSSMGRYSLLDVDDHLDAQQMLRQRTLVRTSLCGMLPAYGKIGTFGLKRPEPRGRSRALPSSIAIVDFYDRGQLHASLFPVAAISAVEAAAYLVGMALPEVKSEALAKIVEKLTVGKFFAHRQGFRAVRPPRRYLLFDK